MKIKKSCFISSFRSVITCLLICCFVIHILNVPSCFAATRSERLLEAGIRAYEKADFQQAEESIQEALEKGLTKDSDRIRAYQYMGYLFTLTGNLQSAQLEFAKALQIDHEFRLSEEVSPRFRDVFQLALDAMPEKQETDTDPPAIQCDLPDAVNENMSLIITATIQDASEIQSACLFYRTAGTMPFTMVNMNRISDNRFNTTLFEKNVQPDALEIYIKATDEHGNGPGWFGDSEHPHRIQVIEKIVESPVAAKPESSKIEPKAKKSNKIWLWIAGGAALLGGAVVMLMPPADNTSKPQTGIIEIEIPDQP